MKSKPESYPAVYIIFTLLNAIRRGIKRNNIWREFRRQKIVFKPRLAFWLAVCKEAGLIDDYEDQPRVTRHARSWLNKTPEEQAFHLLDCWQNTSINKKARQFRKKLLWKLKYNKPLTQKDMGVVNGLEALGIVTSQGQLTKWGEYIIKGQGKLLTPKPNEPCKIHEDNFLAPLPQHIDLLWELEKHLRPLAPGKYPLTNKYTPAIEILIPLLEQGLKDSLPGDVKARLLNQPSLRVSEGIVLEFSHPDQIRELRRQPRLRQHIEQFLPWHRPPGQVSPRHILVSSKKVKALYKILQRRGIYMENHEEQIKEPKRRTHFPHSPKTMLQPVGKSVPKMEILEMYKRWQQAVDIWYRTPGYPAEQRRITPYAS